MRKLFTFILLAAVAAADVCAQQRQIAVVTEDDVTSIFMTLDSAITSAVDGCVIYLPGGHFSISESITKRLTIIGVTHNSETDYVDGPTHITGNIVFSSGSDGSALMGVYADDNVNIGSENDTVKNILVRYCNVNGIYVKNSACEGIVVNQSFLRSNDNTFCYTDGVISNCVVGSINYVTGGIIDHNVIYSYSQTQSGKICLSRCINSTRISNNIFLFSSYSVSYCFAESNYNSVYNNGYREYIASNGDYGNDAILFTRDAVIGSDFGVSPQSDFHLADSIGIGAASDGTDIGIYGGSGFKDNCLVPIPRIVGLIVQDQTDVNGKLNIRVEAKFD